MWKAVKTRWRSFWTRRPTAAGVLLLAPTATRSAQSDLGINKKAKNNFTLSLIQAEENEKETQLDVASIVQLPVAELIMRS